MSNYTISFDFRKSLGFYEGEFTEWEAKFEELEPILRNMQARCKSSKDDPHVKIRWGIFRQTLISGNIEKCLLAVTDDKIEQGN